MALRGAPADQRKDVLVAHHGLPHGPATSLLVRTALRASDWRGNGPAPLNKSGRPESKALRVISASVAGNFAEAAVALPQVVG